MNDGALRRSHRLRLRFKCSPRLRAGNDRGRPNISMLLPPLPQVLLDIARLVQPLAGNVGGELAQVNRRRRGLALSAADRQDDGGEQQVAGNALHRSGINRAKGLAKRRSIRAMPSEVKQIRLLRGPLEAACNPKAVHLWLRQWAAAGFYSPW